MPINMELLDSIRRNAFSDPDLSLVEKDLTDEDLPILADALKNNSHIKNLYLSDNNISSVGARFLAENLPKLEELDVSANNIGAEGCIALSKTSIRKINISANPTGDAISAFATSASLVELCAFQCQVTDVGAEPLFSSSSIRKLDLGNNGISGICLRNIIHNNVLKDLKLSQNSILEEHCRYIGENKSLTHLNLANIYSLSDKAAKFVAQSSSLGSLSMGECAVKDEGAIALSTNKTLRKLLLPNNRIGDKGGIALAANISLLHIDLEGNSISSNILADLEKQYMQSSHYLEFTRTPEYIQELLKKRNVNKSELSLSSDDTPTMEKMNKEATNQSSSSVSAVPGTQIDAALPPSFTPHRQMTQSPKEEVGKIKAKRLLSMPEFVEFFRTADPQQIRIFFDAIEEDREEFNKKQKTSYSTPTNGGGRTINYD